MKKFLFIPITVFMLIITQDSYGITASEISVRGAQIDQEKDEKKRAEDGADLFIDFVLSSKEDIETIRKSSFRRFINDWVEGINENLNKAEKNEFAKKLLRGFMKNFDETSPRTEICTSSEMYNIPRELQIEFTKAPSTADITVFLPREWCSLNGPNNIFAKLFFKNIPTTAFYEVTDNDKTILKEDFEQFKNPYSSLVLKINTKGGSNSIRNFNKDREWGYGF